jgi:Holliday junction resolvase-like predicted endonuclease
MFSWLNIILHWLGRGDAGARGERLAADFLQREHGFAILARNWRNPRDRREELDLVCRDGDALVFVEVKTRSSAALVTGYHAVTRRKKRVLLRCRAGIPIPAWERDRPRSQSCANLSKPRKRKIKRTRKIGF